MTQLVEQILSTIPAHVQPSIRDLSLTVALVQRGCSNWQIVQALTGSSQMRPALDRPAYVGKLLSVARSLA